MESWCFWILVYLSALAVAGWAFRDCQRRLWWKCAFLPAVLLEGTVRALTASLSGQRVRRFGALRNGRPFVELSETARPWFGPAARLVLGQAAFIAVFFLICPLSDAAREADLSLPEQRMTLDAVPQKIGGLVGLLQAFGRAVAAIRPDSPWTWIGLHLAIGLSVAFSVGRREWIAGATLAIGATASAALLRWLGFHYGFLSRAWWIRRLYVSEVAERFALLCAFALGVALAGLAWRTAARSLRRG